MMKPKPCGFTKYLMPDSEVPTIAAARTSPKVRDQRIVKGGFTWVAPEPREKYQLRWVSPDALKILNLEVDDNFKQVVSGQKVVDTDDIYPYAQNYSGYQFGNWAGQLGDGRAISLFELEGTGGLAWELQLKGAGLTPYSRFADGKAVLRSSIREALASEAVNALGIPTTRALALTELPDTTARRETRETCAVVARFAPSWVRFGTFELYHSRNNRAGLRSLADYCINRFYPLEGYAQGTKNRYYEFWRSVSLRNAEMVAKTQAYGFLNGVLNTDNTSILGLSIDYGPFAFMDAFSFGYTPNHDDGENRYGFRNAPLMIWWNCVRLGETLGELMGAGSKVDSSEFHSETLDRQSIANLATKLIMDVGEEFENSYKSYYLNAMRKRLGLEKELKDDDDFVQSLLKVLDSCELDYNRFFRVLSKTNFYDGKSPDAAEFVSRDRGTSPLKSKDQCMRDIGDWLVQYAARLEQDGSDDKARQERMLQVNPNFVLRNWVLSDVIAEAQAGNWAAFEEVAKMALDPFSEHNSKYLGDVPEFERNSHCSCSS